MGKILALPKSVEKAQRVVFSFNTASPLVLQAVAAGSSVTRAMVLVDQAFDDPSASITLGPTFDPSGVLASDDVDLQILGQYESMSVAEFAAPDFLELAISPGTSTHGAGTLYYWTRG